MGHVPGNLPQALTSFVGRRGEVSATRQRMSESRLVTLVGVGGVGKTRLAIEVASAAVKAFPDGVWMVELAPLSDGSRVAQTVASALDIRDQSKRSPSEKLVEHLTERQALIVLDNCEHLLDACASLADELLRRVPGLRILATSREALGVEGEHLLTVDPLQVHDDRSPATMARSDAVALLVDRARAVRPGFAVTEENADDIGRLCARLDGMPLAIELAAVRLRSLSVSGVVARLDDRFTFLTQGTRTALPRQQTLRALMDWSYDLCTVDEQSLWRRLSVFAGTFDLAAAEGVCADEALRAELIFDVLDHLVAKSIVLAEPHGASLRYRMLGTVRDYGATRIDDDDARLVLSRRHRDHYLGRAQAMADAWAGPGQATELARMREDHANLRAALQWSMVTPTEAEAGATLAVALRWHWVIGGFLAEGARWLDQALELVDEGSARASALWVSAWVSLVQGQRDIPASRLDECAAFAEAVRDDGLAAHVAQWKGITALFTLDPIGAVPQFERAVALHGVAGDTAAGLFSMFQLAIARAYTGDLSGAARTCEEGMRRSVSAEERWARAYLHWAAAIVAWHAGDHRTVEQEAREGLAIERDFEDGICGALTLEVLAWATAARCEFTAAAEFLGAARSIWRAIGTSVDAFGPMAIDSAACAQRTCGALGVARFEAALASGTRATIADALALGLGERRAATVVDDSPLSPRELEVARLIAGGASNKAIAEQLVLSVRTIDGHVERILGKLGFSSRTQVATWITERETIP